MSHLNASSGGVAGITQVTYLTFITSVLQELSLGLSDCSRDLAMYEFLNSSQ